MVALASGQSNPSYIALDATSVYWTNYNDGTVMKALLGGGAATKLASGQSGPAGIAVDGTSVYWVNQGSYKGVDGAVMSVPLAGGTPTRSPRPRARHWPSPWTRPASTGPTVARTTGTDTRTAP
jgi:predicted heme/steroid binding protein